MLCKLVTIHTMQVLIVWVEMSFRWESTSTLFHQSTLWKVTTSRLCSCHNEIDPPAPSQKRLKPRLGHGIAMQYRRLFIECALCSANTTKILPTWWWLFTTGETTVSKKMPMIKLDANSWLGICTGTGICRVAYPLDLVRNHTKVQYWIIQVVTRRSQHSQECKDPCIVWSLWLS